MSIGLLLEYTVPAKESELIPIATEEAFQKYWQPGCTALHLRWIPLFSAGLPLQHEDVAFVLEELEGLKQWLSCHTATGLPQAVVLRLDHLVQALRKAQGDAQVTMYIG